ncbi:MAG: molecular chaperone DnaJ [Gammaproteobacteria bacterium]|nr:molecular chaperone DnaJ [Gammaproteobacteria bacterium]
MTRQDSGSQGGFGSSQADQRKRRASGSRKRKPGTSNHQREQCPLGRDPDLEAIVARQSLGLPLTGRLTDQQVKRAHKQLAVRHHPDKGGDPEAMTRFNRAKDALLQREMEAIPA